MIPSSTAEITSSYKAVFILEPTHHEILVLSLISSCQEAQVYLITSSEYLSSLNSIHPQILNSITGTLILKEVRHEPVAKYIKEVERQLDLHNDECFLIVPTIRGNFAEYSKLTEEFRTWLFIHNISYWSNKLYSHYKPCEFLRLLFGRSGMLRLKMGTDKKNILNNSTLINIHNPTLDYLALGQDPAKYTFVAYRTQARLMSQKHRNVNGKHSLTLGFICELGTMRKDPLAVAQLLRDALTFNPNNVNLKLYVIGQVKNKDLWSRQMSQLTKLVEKTPHLSIFISSSSEKLPEASIVRLSSELHALISASPSNLIKPFWGYKEVYGISTSSGCIHDALWLRLPLFSDIDDEIHPDLISQIHLYDRSNPVSLMQAIHHFLAI